MQGVLGPVLKTLYGLDCGVTPINFHSSLIFAGKARSPIRGSTLVNSSLACKCWTRAEESGTDRHHLIKALIASIKIYCTGLFGFSLGY